MRLTRFLSLSQTLTYSQTSTGSDNVIQDSSDKDEVPPSDSKANDSVEGKPGIIESTELAPLGDGKVAADREWLTPLQTIVWIFDVLKADSGCSWDHLLGYCYGEAGVMML